MIYVLYRCLGIKQQHVYYTSYQLSVRHHFNNVATGHQVRVLNQCHTCCRSQKDGCHSVVVRKINIVVFGCVGVGLLSGGVRVRVENWMIIFFLLHN